MVAWAASALAQAPAQPATRPTQIEALALRDRLAALPAGDAPALVVEAPAAPAGAERTQAATGVVRSRAAALDPAALDALMSAPDLMVNDDGTLAGSPITFRLALFNDTGLRLVKLDSRIDDQGITVVRGLVLAGPGAAGPGLGTATLAIDGADVTGSVRLGRRTYTILPATAGGHRIAEIDLTGLPRVLNDAVRPPVDDAGPPTGTTTETPPAQERKSSTAPAAPRSLERVQDGETIVTLFVAYTPTASATIPNIKSAISLAVSDTNTALANSQIPVRISLVGIDRVNYSENGASMSTVLDAVADSAGDFARIQNVRNALDADLVSVIAKTSDACGLAFLNDTLSPNFSASQARFGTNVVAADANAACIATNTLAHEIGHNFGAEHDRFVVTDDQPGPTKYGYGYVDLTGRFRDIMSYDDQCQDQNVDCTEVPFFSNPNLTYQGRPLGVAFDQPNSAHASRKMGEIAPIVAMFDTVLATPGTPVLSVLVQGLGSVASSPTGIDCGDSCSANFAGGPTVNLTATAAARSALQGWSGACTGSGACAVTVDVSRSVTATFTPAERSGPIFSTAQPASQSFLRFYNTGTSAGTVQVALADTATGNVLTTWTSPSIPSGAALQFQIGTIEAGIPAATPKPAYYAATVRPGISGFFQHVLWRPADGTLTNLSTCEASSTANATTLSNVHSSILDNGYPSSVVITNTDSRSAQVTLGIFDARDGSRLGTYRSSAIGADAQVILSVATIEAGAGITPTSAMFHYVIKVESSFTGFLQHLVNNQRTGVITDMTTMCAFNALPTRVATEAIIQPGALFSSAQADSRSFLRFQNTGSAAGTVNITLLNPANGQRLGQWTSPPIAPGAAPQFPITTIETGLTAGVTKPANYSALVQTQMDGAMQHVLFRQSDGTLTNLSTCNAAITANGSQIANVHSALLANGYPSTVAVSNTGGAAASATLGIYDAATGARLGTFPTPSIPAGGQAVITVSSIEAGAGITPSANQFHYIIKIENAFRGFVQHLVNNQQAGVITDMTTVCRLPARALSYTDCSAGFTQACPIGTQGASVTGQIKKNGAFEFYRVAMSQGQTYVIEAKGADSNNGTLAGPYVFVHRPNFSVTAQGGGGGTGRDTRLSYTATESGDFVVVVTGSTFTQGGIVTAHPSGTYTLSIRQQD